MTTQKNPEHQLKTGQAPPSLKCDYDQYAACLEDCDLTDEQKREFLEAMWTIISAFVDLGFGHHPVQHVLGNKVTPDLPSMLFDMLSSDSSDTKPEQREPQP